METSLVTTSLVTSAGGRCSNDTPLPPPVFRRVAFQTQPSICQPWPPSIPCVPRCVPHPRVPVRPRSRTDSGPKSDRAKVNFCQPLMGFACVSAKVHSALPAPALPPRWARCSGRRGACTARWRKCRFACRVCRRGSSRHRAAPSVHRETAGKPGAGVRSLSQPRPPGPRPGLDSKPASGRGAPGLDLCSYPAYQIQQDRVRFPHAHPVFLAHEPQHRNGLPLGAWSNLGQHLEHEPIAGRTFGGRV